MKRWQILSGVFGVTCLLMLALTTTFAQSFAENKEGTGGFALIYIVSCQRTPGFNSR